MAYIMNFGSLPPFVYSPEKQEQQKELEIPLTTSTMVETLQKVVYTVCPRCYIECPSRSFYRKHLSSSCDLLPLTSQFTYKNVLVEGPSEQVERELQNTVDLEKIEAQVTKALEKMHEDECKLQIHWQELEERLAEKLQAQRDKVEVTTLTGQHILIDSPQKVSDMLTSTEEPLESITAPSKKKRRRNANHVIRKQFEVIEDAKECGVRKSEKRKKPKNRVNGSVTNLLLFLRNIWKTRSRTLEIGDKKKVTGKYVRYEGVPVLKMNVKHLSGKRHKRDFECDKWTQQQLEILGDVVPMNKQWSLKNILPGTSGFLIPRAAIKARVGNVRGKFLLVRGFLEGYLLDARSKLTSSMSLRIHHYSNPGEAYWKGFTKTFQELKPKNLDHTCKTDFNVEESGSVAAIVYQALFPCGRVTCRNCAETLDNKTHHDIRRDGSERIENAIRRLRENHPDFRHVKSTLEAYDQLDIFNAFNYDAFAEISSLIGNRTTTPFTHVNYINETLFKEKTATSEELYMAHAHLLEIARYMKNRFENIKNGSLESFRNTISAKTHINPVLMCDNQLDQNGNFIWGKRGVHAKRFFQNFFDVIDPKEGYDKFIKRQHVRGERELAIGNLMVSMNFDTLRNQLKGKKVDAHKITQSCISKQGSAFVHPCCCVTQSDGTALLSKVLAPTKGHLVLGNTGDPKYVDLPSEDGPVMYIAKNGYCYLNIFLAMLVNVNEDEALRFTKIVRDELIPRLGEWPKLTDLAIACYALTIFFPETRNAELPRILVDHTNKTLHIVDSYGSLNTQYHILKANTVSQLIMFEDDELESEIKFYNVGGLDEMYDMNTHNMQTLIRSIYKPQRLKDLLIQEPFLLLYSVLSPGVLLACYNSGTFEEATRMFIKRDHHLASMSTLLSLLAEKVSVAKTLVAQNQVISAHSSTLNDCVFRGSRPEASYTAGLRLLEHISSKAEMNKDLQSGGFVLHNHALEEVIEKNYLEELEAAWRELSWLEKFSSIRQSSKLQRSGIKPLHPTKSTDLGGRYDISWKHLLNKSIAPIKQKYMSVRSTMIEMIHVRIGKIACYAATLPFRRMPDIYKMINTMLLFSAFLNVCKTVDLYYKEYTTAKQHIAIIEAERKFNEGLTLYHILHEKLGMDPTKQEYIDFVSQSNKALVPYVESIVYGADNKVSFQAKRQSEARLEQIVAFMALVLMIFDAQKSDCVYKMLNKLKGLVTTLDDNTVYFQSLDDITSILDEKNLTVDFEVQTSDTYKALNSEPTFEQWWTNQLNRNNVVPHYRTEGHFIEFTRENAAAVASEIVHSSHTDFLIRGAVGSGKSTGLPSYLCTRGSVLLLEPTRPLAENVCKQLRSEHFNLNPTLRMRGLNTFGSTPITIMTSGFALHYLAHNPLQLKNYDYILFDECHVNDSSAMAFRCLLKEFEFAGKILKVSATPPGREVEFKTQHPVKILVEESMSLHQFVETLGTKANADITATCDNVLVYVSSYNEVDTLSKLLLNKEYIVTKVDGRTMKLGNIEIVTRGTAHKKHFIVATNIIENGVTLDIDGVVDFGMKVVPHLDVDNRMLRYNKTSISYGERIQRLGRVGRNKPGVALRINHTEKGLIAIPTSIATEAAFLCFAYGLPTMTHNVSTSILSNVTVQQARTMLQFELSPFYTCNLVRFDGSMHKSIHDILKEYKLRESETVLNKLAIPSKCVGSWLTAGEYDRMGGKTYLNEDVRIPFLLRDVPELVHDRIWKAIQLYKQDAGFGRLTSAQACKIAYTLQTDVHSIPRTLQILDALLASERTKQAHYQSITTKSCSSSTYSLNSIVHMIQSKYMKDHSSENIQILQLAKAQILEFQNLGIDPNCPELLRNFTYADCVHFQSTNQMSEHLQLKGRWNRNLISRDLIIVGGFAIGGVWMLYEHFKKKFEEVVYYQGSNKRQRQKLRFREARDRKGGYEVHADDNTIEHYFGDAYTKKGKQKGKARGMGLKNRRFVNMYGYDPSDYSFVRFVDPLTATTLDENTMTDIHLVQEHFTKMREEAVQAKTLDKKQIEEYPGIRAYYVNNFTKKALKIELFPHIPLAVGRKHNTISGFPEREGELRQTGDPVAVSLEEVPEICEESVEYESKSLFKGLRDYNPIAACVCHLVNESNGHVEALYGIGFGNCIITNQHLFRHNNGQLTIRSHHGEFVVKSTPTLSIKSLPGIDMLLIKLPKDFPPFPQKLKFRVPKAGERVCMVGTNYQQKSVSSVVSEMSTICPNENSHFWRHWISTKPGYCGMPLVSTNDGYIVGIHSLSNFANTTNHFTSFPENFSQTYLEAPENLDWIKHWKFNSNDVMWGSLKLHESQPGGMFNITKLISDLGDDAVFTQGGNDKWMYNALSGNLRAVAQCPSQLVTKHVVKGKCALFETYLRTNEETNKLFQPYLGEYQKSRLNREAYIKDIMKYATPIVIGEVQCDLFEEALEVLKMNFNAWGFEKCTYVTDTDAIFSSLNMKSAVGALYSGKKRDYFQAFVEEEKDQIIKESCLRLYTGKKGIWNGSLKAELRPSEKVEANKTRTFTAAPLDTLLGGKVCVDDFNNQFYSMNIRCPWSVGMTKFYAGWNSLMEGLPDGWLYCDADGSRFDSSLSPYLINAVLQLRLHYMEEWDIGEQMLKNLYTEIVYTPISTPDGTIVKKFKGNNSGQPSTVVDNTLMVILATIYTLLKLGYSGAQQNDICRYFVNGDDLLIAVHPDHIHILNSFQENFSQLGLDYDFSNRTMEKEELWFMSHRAVKVEGVYIPKLEEARIISILEWDRSNEPVHRLEAICAAMIESWGYQWLTHEIRKFYSWVLDQAPYNQLARDGKAPYIAEPALRSLYLNTKVKESELERYIETFDSLDEPHEITFVTGNMNKLNEVRGILNAMNVQVTHKKMDLIEIQGSMKEIAKQKALDAFKELKQAVLIEDTSLIFEAMNNFPGPYIKHLTNNKKIVQMLEAFDNKDATAICTFVYYDGITEPIFFEGRTHGHIVDPKGENGFGWDEIFECYDAGKTFAEMNGKEKAHYSPRGKALCSMYRFFKSYLSEHENSVYFQSGTQNAGIDEKLKLATKEDVKNKGIESSNKDKDINAGTMGTFVVPKLKRMPAKIAFPRVRGKVAINLNHLLSYNPQQSDLSNTRSTHEQFASWYDGVKESYGVDDNEMSILLNGFMVWCIENGTSPNLNGSWTMMENDVQHTYPLRPMIEHAKPTLRQTMAHFSNTAEAYIEMRNMSQTYIPRYALQRNLTDPSLARYGFDFYEVDSKTPIRAREAHIQMKAAALRGVTQRMFGLDGNIGNKEEDTERHTTDDVNRNMHNLLGMRNM
nr:polyprotein [Mercurialis mosaic virus]